MNVRVPIQSTAIALLLLIATRSSAIIVWQESINGDLSNTQASPTNVALGNGANSFIGSVQNGPDVRDWVTVNVPVGFQLNQLINSAYTSTDAQGHMGFQIGSVFVGAFNSNPAVYHGYSHFGFAAQNGSFPVFNSVGQDMLPIMQAQGAGSQGFSVPLGAGNYAFLFQQTGTALTQYQFDFMVTPVPEPGTMLLAGIGAVAFARRAWKRRGHAMI